MQVYNVYCDESCHLEHDNHPVMGFGAILCRASRLAALNQVMATLKEKHRAKGELKWEKVSPARLPFYLELIDWFFAEPDLRFRGWLVTHKERLDHGFFNSGSHDSFYYKMYYYLLDPVITWPQPGEEARRYRIFLDVKDTRSRLKVQFLRDVLRSKKRDREGTLISLMQSSPAEELQLMQLADFLLGALTFANRPTPNPSQAKTACVRRIEERGRFCLTIGTPPWQNKFNFFVFTPREATK